MITISSYTRLKLIAVAVLLALLAGIFAYDIFIGAPRRKCEAAGNWWSYRYMQCAKPIILSVPVRAASASEATSR